MSTANVSAKAETASLAPGQVVGGRFHVDRLISEDALGWLFGASDQKTSRPVALRLVRASAATPAAAEALRDDVRIAAGLTDRSVAATYGLGAVAGGALFVASEGIDGDTIANLMARRRKADAGGVSLGGAYTIIRYVCQALGAAHDKTSHGAVRPHVVWVTKRGRIKLGEFGVAKALLRTLGPSVFAKDDQPYLAPEVRSGATFDGRADVFGLGALAYVMLTARSPAEDFIAPSNIHPEAGPEVDQWLMRCLAADPAQRFTTTEEARSALAAIIGDAPPFEGLEFGVALNIGDPTAKHVQKPATSPAKGAPPQPHGPGSRGAPKGPAPAPGAPRVGQRVSIHDQFRASAPPEVPEAQVPTHSPSGQVDLGAVLAKITENDAPRWMVVKNKLDHGPFSGRELVQLILKGDVLADHGLLNMDTGERKRVNQFPDFADFVDQYRVRKRDADERAAVERSTKVESASNVVKALIALAIVGVIGGGVAVYYATRAAAGANHRTSAEVADLFERGEIHITGTAGILPPPTPRHGGGHGGGAHPGGGGHGGMSYEDAMNQVVNLGDARNGGGEDQLTSSTVQGVMNAHINSFYSCVGQELRRGTNMSSVHIDLAIAGSGQVLGASVTPGSSDFQSCVAGRVRAVHFPSFGAIRMGARFSFSVGD